MFLPPVDNSRVAGLQTYPQPPVLRNSSNRGSLIAERKELTTWIASTPGDLVIPEVSINWLEYHDTSSRASQHRSDTRHGSGTAPSQSAHLATTDCARAPLVGWAGYSQCAGPFGCLWSVGARPAAIKQTVGLGVSLVASLATTGVGRPT